MAHISSVSTLTPTFTHPSTFSPTQYTQHMLYQLKWSPFLCLQRHPTVYTLLFTHSHCLHTPIVYILRLRWQCQPCASSESPHTCCGLCSSCFFFPPQEDRNSVHLCWQSLFCLLHKVTVRECLHVHSVTAGHDGETYIFKQRCSHGTM